MAQPHGGDDFIGVQRQNNRPRFGLKGCQRIGFIRQQFNIARQYALAGIDFLKLLKKPTIHKPVISPLALMNPSIAEFGETASKGHRPGGFRSAAPVF